MLTTAGIRLNGAHLFLHKGQLLQVALQERHLLLLRLAVAVADDIVVLLLDFVKLDLKFDDLTILRVSVARSAKFISNSAPSRNGSADRA